MADRILIREVLQSGIPGASEHVRYIDVTSARRTRWLGASLTGCFISLLLMFLL